MTTTGGRDIIWRKVVEAKRHYVPWEWSFGYRGASSVTLKLDCGHEKMQKGNVPIPKKARCRECEYHAWVRKETTS